MNILIPSIEYLINLPLALHYDKLQKLPMAATMQTSAQTLQLSIPNITRFIDEYDRDRTKAKELSINLKEIVRNAKDSLTNVKYMNDQMPALVEDYFWLWNSTYGDARYVILFLILYDLMGFSYYHQQVLKAKFIKLSLERTEAAPIDNKADTGYGGYRAAPSLDMEHDEIYVEIVSHPLTTICVGLVVFIACIIYVIKGMSLLYIHFAKISAFMHRHCQACISPRQYLYSYYLYIKISNSHAHAIIYITKIELDTAVTGLNTHPQIQRPPG